jgi:two-component system, OmpR family, sensor histidine kinase TctE
MRHDPPFLRQQLLGWLLIPLFVLLVADAFVSYWIAVKFSEKANDRALHEIARDVSLHLAVEHGRLKLDLPAAARKLLFTDPDDRIYFEVTTPAEERIEGTPIPPPSRVSGDTVVFYDGLIATEPVRVVHLYLAADHATSRPGAHVRIAETKNKRNSLTREILASVVAPQLLLIIIAGLLVWVGVRRGLAPLDKLRRAVSARSSGDWSPVSVSGVPGEVRPLLESINELLTSLDAALTLQSRFIGDAAHQIKTPLAALETRLELAMRENDLKGMRESLKDVYAGLERLSHVFSQILSLARNEPGAMRQLVRIPVDIDALALDVSANWVSAALKKQIDLGFEGCDKPVIIHGDPIRLRELCDNLIDNAVRYSRNGGRVTVRVSARPTPALAVSDDSPSIPLSDRQRIFERFHRVLGTTEEGSGLGLAIVKEIAHLHGAEMGLCDDEDGTGHTFSVIFPSS